MAQRFDTLSEELADFVRAQPVFFVASAPLSADGHVNVSPKGLDTLRVLGADRVAYLDLTGSGNETSAHVAENGRITIMLCSFGAQARILRIYGRGRAILPEDQGWPELRRHFGDYPGVRQIIDVAVDEVQTSCGYAVPRMDLVGARDTLIRWAERKGEQGTRVYQKERNARSIDGLVTPIGRRDRH
ncbi:MAG TPA: pyridoxamine 5'-phosphate oxidase family protein [Candidatus Limnocylindrales bacterium]|nr:pyridoxamine 5'-phosphate oxidase family protein [Candidatus Limnocylindrales bacterium]